MGMKLEGLDILAKSINAIEKNTKKAVKKAVAVGSKVIVRAARAKIKDSKKPKMTYLGTYRQPGNLRKSIKIKMLKVKYPDTQTAIVGPSVGKREKNDGWYGRLVEEGHKTAKATGTYWSKRKKKTMIKWEYGGTDVEAHPFMRPAYDENINAANRKMAEVFKDAIEGKMIGDISEITGLIIDDIGGD